MAYPYKTLTDKKIIFAIIVSEGNGTCSDRMEVHRNGGAGELGAVKLHGVGGFGVGCRLPSILGARNCLQKTAIYVLQSRV